MRLNRQDCHGFGTAMRMWAQSTAPLAEASGRSCLAVLCMNSSESSGVLWALLPVNAS